jgi:Kef-type K+ transport system membrane component KefB
MTVLCLALLLQGVDPEAGHLPLAVLLVFGAAKLFAEVFERLRQPGIVGEIIAGIVIGPSVLGWVEPTEFITALAELGVMFLLFRVGMEVRASELVKVGGTAALVAILGVIVPFALGWGLAVIWDHRQIEAIFIGASMVATSVGITAQVLASKGLLQLRSSQIILGAAVIDDVLGLIVLAIVSSVVRGGINFVELLLTAGLAVGFTIIVAKWGTRAMSAIMPRVEQKISVAEGQFALAICLLFGLSLLAVYAGVAAIIGAFLAGMALSESVGHRVHDLTSGVTELLVPFFLVSIGLHFNLQAFADPATIVFAIVILAAAIVSKLFGCGLGALRMGKADAFRIGVGMVPRGEVGMVVAQLGLAMAIVTEGVFGVVVFMSVMTTIIAPPLLALAYKGVTGGPPAEERIRIG